MTGRHQMEKIEKIKIKKISRYLPLIILCIMFLAHFVSAAEISPDNELPILEITTENKLPIKYKDKYISAEMTLTDSDTQSFFNIQIRGRGNSTWGMSKKPYRIKLDKKADLFGMGSSKHWILLANAFDGSHLRNKLSYDLSGAMGMTAIQSVFVNVVLNGKYIGLYQLTESIRAEDGRIPILDWEDIAKDAAEAIAKKENLNDEDTLALKTEMEQDLSWITSGMYGDYTISDYINIARYSTTGGYILELDEYYDELSRFTTPEDVPIMIHSPEYLYTNKEMFYYIRDWIFDMEEAMFAYDGYNTDGKHYSEYLDMESFTDYWIVNQVFKSVELLYKSCFMYKDSGEKLTFGPVWDMDWSSGNHSNLGGDSADPCTWTHDQSQDREYWYRALYDQPSFIVMIQDRWWEIRPLLNEMLDSIDTLVSDLTAAANDNHNLWGGKEFSWETDELKAWLVRRIEWMDEQLAKRDPDITGRGIKENTDYTITITDADGAALSADTVSEEYRRADLYYCGNSQLTVTIDTKSPDIESVDIYINGIHHQSVAASDGIAVCTVEMSELKTDGSRNVIRAIARDSAMPDKPVGERYVTLYAEIVNVPIIKAQTVETSSIEEVPVSDTSPAVKSFPSVVAVVCAVALISGFLMLNKRRKSQK